LIAVCQIWLQFVKFDCSLSNLIAVCRIWLQFVEFDCSLSNLIAVCQIWLQFIKFDCSLSNLVAVCQIWLQFVKFGCSWRQFAWLLPSTFWLSLLADEFECRLANLNADMNLVPDSEITLILQVTEYTWSNSSFQIWSVLSNHLTKLFSIVGYKVLQDQTRDLKNVFLIAID
jgi:hypothetical protein